MATRNVFIEHGAKQCYQKGDFLQIGLLGKKAMIHCKVKGQTLANRGPVLTFLNKALYCPYLQKLC